MSNTHSEYTKPDSAAKNVSNQNGENAATSSQPTTTWVIIKRLFFFVAVVVCAQRSTHWIMFSLACVIAVGLGVSLWFDALEIVKARRKE